MPSSSDGPRDDSPSHYELLQLAPNFDAQELRLAFRRLSKRYHPDTTLLPADQAQEAFRRLQQAYAVLSDPQARRAYDSRRLAALHLAVARPSQPPPPRLGEPKPVPVHRALSGGEWFALLLLAVALVLSLVLGIGVAWARGAELVRQPSWWPPAGTGRTVDTGSAVGMGSAAGTGRAVGTASGPLATPLSSSGPDTPPLSPPFSAPPSSTPPFRAPSSSTPPASAPSSSTPSANAAATDPRPPGAIRATAASAASATTAATGLPPSSSLPERP